MFSSTRQKADRVSFETALLQGLAPDGGLYLPDTIPSVDPAWKSASSFQDVAMTVLRSWLSRSLGKDAVDDVVTSALDFEVPIVELTGDRWSGISIVELFHGPTLSFKDFGARSMAGFINHALSGGPHRTILVATSGDTGSAVADGFAGLESVDVVLLYPHGQVSPTQERQLVVTRPGVTTFAVDGTFDDCQRMVKEVFARQSSDDGRFSSANSINVGRLIPQMVYYYWAAANAGPGFRCCVPSGNLGNLTAGVLAHLSGMPAGQFVAAHNANSFFPNYLASGDTRYRDSVRTLSNAMDVGVPSNFERLTVLLSESAMRELIWSTSVDDETTLSTIRDVFEETGYTLDPHTAVGLEATRRYREATGDHGPMTVMATAHPAKFPETITQALGSPPATPERLQRYWEMDTSVQVIDPDTDSLLVRLDA
ncbi:MAG: threonine synthase [Rhodothermia bacterium]|nr:threonine synthase [Rhodothermia bacterium]